MMTTEQVVGEVDLAGDVSGRVADERACLERVTVRQEHLCSGTLQLVGLVRGAWRMPERGHFAHAEHAVGAEQTRRRGVHRNSL